MTSVGLRLAGGLRRARVFGALLSAQALAQALTVVTGFLLLRWLSVDAYAQYTVALGFLATLSVMIDLGISGAVMPLVGDRARDPRVFGAYLRSALHLRTRLAVIILPLGAIAFLLLTAGRDWGLGVRLGLFATVALGLMARTTVDIFALPLLMNEAYRSYYAPQISTAVGRLGVYAILEVTRGLASVTAMLASGVAVLVNGALYRRSGAGRSVLPAVVDPERTREIRDIVAPRLAGLVFFAFQGQITILLASVFARTQSIAEVGALARLGALFAVLAGLASVLVAPRFPQIPRDLLVRRTLQTVAGAVAAGALLTAFAFLEPGPLLFLLGPAYHGLRVEVAWFMVAASVSFVADLLYLVNLARRFVWWWATALNIGLILATQVACATVLDLGSTLELQYFAAITGVAACTAQVVTLLRGLRRGPRTL